MFRIVTFFIVAIFVSLAPATASDRISSAEDSTMLDSLRKIDCPDTITVTICSHGAAAAESLFAMPALADRKDLPMWFTFALDEWLSYAPKRDAIMSYALTNIIVRAILDSARYSSSYAPYIDLQAQALASLRKLKDDFGCIAANGGVVRVVYDPEVLADPMAEQDRMMANFRKQLMAMKR